MYNYIISNINISNSKRAIWVGILILLAYGVLVSSVTQSKIPVLIADLISGLSVIAIAVLMYPIFKVFNKKASQVYLLLKYIEGFLMIVGGFVFLVSAKFRGVIYDNIHIYVFIIGALVFYYLLYIGKIVPRFISIWGLLGTVALVISTGLKLFNLNFPIVDYFLILIITNEVFLAGWLIFRGFNLGNYSFKLGN
ncbi:MAG: DUF4386 domain-containing protein [Firmicutes bacterium]|nr:DUF4386 domain-containing protein [Bacillota bacterium]